MTPAPMVFTLQGVKDAMYVVGAVMVVVFVVTWTLGKLVERIEEPLFALSGVVMRAGTGLLCGLVAAEAAVSGGYAWIAVAATVPLALWNLTLAAGMIWFWATEGFEETFESNRAH
jgi:hypothetical protein